MWATLLLILFAVTQARLLKNIEPLLDYNDNKEEDQRLILGRDSSPLLPLTFTQVDGLAKADSIIRQSKSSEAPPMISSMTYSSADDGFLPYFFSYEATRSGTKTHNSYTSPQQGYQSYIRQGRYEDSTKDDYDIHGKGSYEYLESEIKGYLRGLNKALSRVSA